jgi:hypothetical protein
MDRKTDVTNNRSRHTFTYEFPQTWRNKWRRIKTAKRVPKQRQKNKEWYRNARESTEIVFLLLYLELNVEDTSDLNYCQSVKILLINILKQNYYRTNQCINFLKLWIWQKECMPGFVWFLQHTSCHFFTKHWRIRHVYPNSVTIMTCKLILYIFR